MRSTLPAVLPVSAVRVPLVCTILVIAAVVAACTAVGLPGSRMPAAFDTSGTRAVLLNVQCVVDGKQREAFAAIPLVRLSLATFETFGEFSPIGLSGLTNASTREGWVCLRLAPGSHYLRVFGPASGPQYPQPQGLPRVSIWRVVVPEGDAPLYIGSLLLAGRTVTRNFLGFKTVEPLDFRFADMRDDSTAAEVVAAREFPDAGAVQTQLLQPWNPGDPMIFRTPRPSAPTR